MRERNFFFETVAVSILFKFKIPYLNRELLSR